MAWNLVYPLAPLWGLLLDAGWGEPPIYHPLVGFGRLAQQVEQHLNFCPNRFFSVLLGLLAWCVCVLPISIFLFWLQWHYPTFDLLLSPLIIYLTVGLNSLKQHASPIIKALQQNDLPLARTALKKIVSRDTHQSNRIEIIQGTIESLLENGSDAIIAPLFWWALGGTGAVVLYRLANTLDAMWGYRNDRFHYFGFWAAKSDDVLNYLPARLTTLLYLCWGSFYSGLTCAYRQSSHWLSPNAGLCMASGAGSLKVKLGGPAYYQGLLEVRPILGCGYLPQIKDIPRAIQLVHNSAWSCALILSLIVFLSR